MTAQEQHYRDKLSYEIDAADLAAALGQAAKVVVIDARTPESYRREHIPGAVNVPHRNLDAEALREFAADALYVAYCDGIGCNASTKAAIKLTGLGRTVKELIGGLDWWKRDGHPTAGEASCATQSGECGCG